MQQIKQNPPTDLDSLVPKFQNKDITAFERLHHMYSESICGAINFVVKNDKDAQDICQEVFMKICNKAETYDRSKGRFFTWILNIARNAAIDRLRSKAHKNKSRTISASKLNDFATYKSYEMEDQLDTNGVEGLLEDLSEKNRQTIILFYLRGYTQKEISEEFNIPLNTVKTRNRNAMLKLRETLDVGVSI